MPPEACTGRRLRPPRPPSGADRCRSSRPSRCTAVTRKPAQGNAPQLGHQLTGSSGSSRVQPSTTTRRPCTSAARMSFPGNLAAVRPSHSRSVRARVPAMTRSAPASSSEATSSAVLSRRRPGRGRTRRQGSGARGRDCRPDRSRHRDPPRESAGTRNRSSAAARREDRRCGPAPHRRIHRPAARRRPREGRQPEWRSLRFGHHPPSAACRKRHAGRRALLRMKLQSKRAGRTDHRGKPIALVSGPCGDAGGVYGPADVAVGEVGQVQARSRPAAARPTPFT